MKYVHSGFGLWKEHAAFDSLKCNAMSFANQIPFIFIAEAEISETEKQPFGYVIWVNSAFKGLGQKSLTVLCEAKSRDMFVIAVLH